MSKSLFKRAAATAQCMRSLKVRFAALMLVLTLTGSLAGALSATSGPVSASGGSSSGGDPGNNIVLAAGPAAAVILAPRSSCANAAPRSGGNDTVA
jgi:hypothetical protein